VSNH